MTDPCYDKPIWTLAALLSILPHLPRWTLDVLPTLLGRGLKNAARERIMLAVAAENRCRYCQAAHSRLGLAAGLGEEEVSEILDGREPPRLAERDRLALRFVRDLAARDFASRDEGLAEAVQQQFTEEERRQVEATAELMNFANRFGNTFDALLARLQGRCESTGASWLDLLFVSSAFLIGAAAASGVLSGSIPALRLLRLLGR